MDLLARSYLLVIALILLLRPHPAQGLKGDAACGRFLCVNATVGEEMITYEVTSVFSRQPGWVAIGFGYHMKSSHMVIMWESINGTKTLSQRYATGHREPIILHNPPRIATLTTPNSYSWQPSNSKTFAFQIPVNYTHRPLNPTDPHIWAYGIRPITSASPDVYFLGQHFAAGSLMLDLSRDVSTDYPPGLQKVGIPYDPPTNDIGYNHGNEKPGAKQSGGHERMLIFHGVLLSLGFLVLLPAGSLAARWGRSLTPAWFPFHQMSNYFLALPVIVLGWLLGPAAVFNAESSHLSDAHKICGVLMIALYFFQINLGRYIHARKKAIPERPPHPPSNILHVAFGITLIALAFLQVRSGLDEWQSATGVPVSPWIRQLWASWVVAVPFAYMAGLILLRRQFFQEENGLRPTFTLESFSDYTMLSGAGNGENIKYDEQVYNESGGMFVNGITNLSSTSLQDTRERDLSVPLLHTR